MASIQPISTSRVTDAMTRGRLTAQIQNDQRDLFRLQNQLSTGFRIFLPSDDASAAQRAMALQRTLERTEQSFTNINGAVASLATTESALAGVGTSLNELKSQALSVVDTITDEDDRQAVIDAIDGLLNDLTRVGNSTFATNYLFGGAGRATEAYQRVGNYVEFLGDESSPQTFVDIGQLFDTGVSGDEVLGGLSESVRGSADLNVQLTPETRLSELNGGVGVTPNGAIQITYVPTLPSDPTTTAIIDLSSARTISDVARLIETGGPENSGVRVEIENNALRIEAEDGALRVEEVAGGVTAAELGVLQEGAAVATINGTDLDPTLRQTTRIDDLFGSKARGTLELAGSNNDLLLTATANGTSFNGVTVDFVAGATAGAESASFSAGVLTVNIASGQSTASDIAAAINAEGTFTAEPDYRDQTSFDARGTGDVDAATGLDPNLLGGVDGDLDLASGLRITNGGEPIDIDTSSAETVEDLLSLLNDPNYGMIARINDSGDGIDVRTRRSGAEFSIGENGGTTATDLGIRSYTADSRLDDFNRGVGVIVPGEADDSGDTDPDTRRQNPFQITVSDNGSVQTFDIDPVGLNTVQDVINAINTGTGGTIDSEGNVLVAGAVTASLATVGNGIELTRTSAVDPNTQATGTAVLTTDAADGGLTDTLTITATSPGDSSNRNFNVVFQDTGSGGLEATVDSDTNTITVNLGGATTDTGAIATTIDAALDDFAANNAGFPEYTVTSAAALAGDPLPTVSVPPADIALNAAGGFLADTFTVSGDLAERLGFISEGETSATSTGETLTSTDRKPYEVDSVFTTLIRMREALEAADSEALGREINQLDADIDRVTAGRAEVGVRLQNLESVEQRLADEEVTLRTALSDEIDADLVEVISDYTAKQYALEASLQTAGSLLSLSILDFI